MTPAANTNPAPRGNELARDLAQYRLRIVTAQARIARAVSAVLPDASPDPRYITLSNAAFLASVLDRMSADIEEHARALLRHGQ